MVQSLQYGKCSKISNTFSHSVLKENVGYQGWNSQIRVRIAENSVIYFFIHSFKHKFGCSKEPSH